MLDLTREDAVEIFYALADKLQVVRDGKYGHDGMTEKWKLHLGAIMEKIGPDGENLTEESMPQCKNKVYLLISGGNTQAVWANDPNTKVILIDEDNGVCDDETAKENAEQMEIVEREVAAGNLHVFF